MHNPLESIGINNNRSDTGMLQKLDDKLRETGEIEDTEDAGETGDTGETRDTGDIRLTRLTGMTRPTVLIQDLTLTMLSNCCDVLSLHLNRIAPIVIFNCCPNETFEVSRKGARAM